MAYNNTNYYDAKKILEGEEINSKVTYDRYTEMQNWPQPGGSQTKHRGNAYRNLETNLTDQRKPEGTNQNRKYAQVLGDITDVQTNGQKTNRSNNIN